jgi:hypothetical protein
LFFITLEMSPTVCGGKERKKAYWLGLCCAEISLSGYIPLAFDRARLLLSKLSSLCLDGDVADCAGKEKVLAKQVLRVQLGTYARLN